MEVVKKNEIEDKSRAVSKIETKTDSHWRNFAKIEEKPANTRGTTSIKNLMNNLDRRHAKNNDESAENTEKHNEKDKIEVLNEDRAAELIKNEWSEIIQKNCNTNSPAMSLMSDESKINIKNRVITFTVSNNIAKNTILEGFNLIKKTLYEKTGLCYEAKFIVDEKERKSPIIVNPEERFRKMSEINPELKNMKDVLKLSIV